jgi:predicted tellurium resistance membrane protein TerC
MFATNSLATFVPNPLPILFQVLAQICVLFPPMENLLLAILGFIGTSLSFPNTLVSTKNSLDANLVVLFIAPLFPNL